MSPPGTATPPLPGAPRLPRRTDRPARGPASPRTRWGLAAWALLAPLAACATRPAPAPPSTTTTTVEVEPAGAAPSDVVPPPLPAAAAEPPAPRTANDPAPARTALRRQIFDAAWTTVRDKHYDRTLGGLDWSALRARYEPLAVAAPDEATFYRIVNDMLGQLGQSHLELSGPGAEPSPVVAEPAPAGAGDVVGDPGLTVRAIDGQPTVTWVRPGSSADRAGIKLGDVVTHVGGRPLVARPPGARALRPVEQRFYLRLTAARMLHGPAGSRVTVRITDAENRPRELLVERDAPRGKPVQFGLLPPFYPDVRVSQIGDVVVIAFNLFLTEGVLPEVQRAIDGARARGARAIILDLRGNPGGLGAMAIPIAARLVDKPVTLGTIQFRDHTQTLTATPSLGVKPFLGRVVIVTDEGTASTSEILAAGLQESGRAIVVGDSTLGAVLPSSVEALPGGAVLQFPVADFRTPKGLLVEGRGVQPDRRVVETRAGLRSGRDPVLDAALVAARGSRS